MANLKQELKIVLNDYAERVADALSDEVFLKGLGELIVKLIIKRTQDGYDIYSRRFGGYNRSYNKKKAYKNADEQKVGKYASNSKSDKLQLTGNLLNSITAAKPKFKVQKNGGIIITGAYVKGTLQRKKAEGLGSTTGVARGGSRYSKKDWLFLGLAIRGSYVKKETEAINKYISDYIGEKLIKSINKKNMG
jgi:hypothetical protein